MVWDVEPRRRYHHGDLRRALVHAAAELLREGGQDALTLRAVARRSGVSHSAPYRHFSDRAALLSAVAAHAFADLVACIHAAPPSPEAAATEIVRFALDAPERYRLMSDTLASGQSAVLGALERTLDVDPGNRAARAFLTAIASPTPASKSPPPDTAESGGEGTDGSTDR